MKLIFLYFTLLVSIFILSCVSTEDNDSHSEISETNESGWELIWFDEFDGNSLDLSKWQYEIDASGGGNNELQYYTSRSQNLHIENGKLIIRALKEKYSQYGLTRDYTSARINTKEKVFWKYVRIDIKAKLPIGKGLWPAIWLLPNKEKYGRWAASGEIDIMEYLGHETDKVYGTIHFGGSFPDNQHSGDFYIIDEANKIKSDFSEDFHIFRIDWEQDEIKWYVDDFLYQSQTNWYTINGEYPAPFDTDFYLIVNLAVGGNWPGNPDITTNFPQEMVIDYIRVYKNLSIPQTTPFPSSVNISCLEFIISEKFIPSGYMGDIEKISQELSYTINPYSEPDCIKVEYKPGSQGFGGVYWQNSINNWGEKRGYNLQDCKYYKCSFWAKGETGTELIEFICGGIKNSEKPYRDSFKVRKKITLSNTWKRYEINLHNENLSDVIGGFCWVASTKSNPTGVTFYLDDIKYE